MCAELPSMQNLLSRKVKWHTEFVVVQRKHFGVSARGFFCCGERGALFYAQSTRPSLFGSAQHAEFILCGEDVQFRL